MSIEGIFRRNGNIRRLKDLTEAIDHDPSSVDLTQDNPVQLAALLKKFLRDLPEPLMTYKLHRLLIQSHCKSFDSVELHICLISLVGTALPAESERRRILHLVSLLLPKSHRDTMEVLFVFLKWVASFAHMDESTGSKMDLQNLATVICPSILYSRGRDAVRDESFGAIRVVTSLLENQDEFYTVPEEFIPALRDQDYFSNSMELPSKEFMKKCDMYMRMKANVNGRQPPPSSSTPSVSTPRPPPERPQLMTASSDMQIRNGRQQSPHSHGSHPVMPYPSPIHPTSLSQGAMMLQSQQPLQQQQIPRSQQPQPPPQDQDWVIPQRPSATPTPSPGGRPMSYAQPRSSSEPVHSGSPNGHHAAPIRQRP